MPNMKSTVQKLWQVFQLTTDKRTGTDTVKQTNKQTKRQDKNNMPRSFDSGA